MNRRYITGEVAKKLGVRAHRIIYALNQGFVEEPEERFNRTRIFTEEDVERLGEYFQAKDRKKGKV
jgi:DNA-binding transcriptional MerR regulator